MVSAIKKKRYIVAAAVTAGILLIALAPFILSSSTALRFVLSGINSRVPGTLSIDSWLVGWQQGVFCQQVVYSDPERGIRVTVPKLTTTQGLMQIVLAPKNLGVLVAEAPVVELVETGKTTESADGLSSAEQGAPQSSGDTPLWNQLTVVLQIRDGLLRTVANTREDAAGIRGVNVDADLQGGVVKFDFDFHTLQGQGTVKVDGSLNLPARQHGWLETLIADMKLSAIGLELHDFLAFAAAYTSFPAGEGVLNADIRVKSVGIEDLQVSGVADVSDLKLVGGLLGDDTPSFQRIHLTVDEGRWSDMGWTVSQLDFDSDTVTFKGSGQFSSEGQRLAGQGVVNLPVLFDQFPRLLSLREAAFVEDGAFDFDVDFMKEGKEGSIKLKAGIENFGGLYDGRKFAWDTPATFIMNAGVQGKEVQVHALRLEAPFLHVEGQGRLESFVLDATLDLQQAFTEIGRLFKIGWDGGGAVEMAVRGTTAEVGADMVMIETDLNVSNFTLNHDAAMVVPLHQLSLTSSVKAPQSLLWEEKGALDLQFVLSSWVGETFLVFNGKKLQGNPFQGYYTMDSTFNLDSLTDFLHAFNWMPGEISMAGDLQVQSAGFLEAGTVEIREFNSEVGGFVLVRDGDIFEDQKVGLKVRQSFNNEIPSFIVRDIIVTDDRDAFFRNGTGLNQIRFGDHSLLLHDLDFSSVQTGKMTLDTLHIPDWQNPLDGLDVAMDGDVDIGRLGGVMRAVGLLPPGIEMAGRCTLTLSAGSGDEDSSILQEGGQRLVADFNSDTVRYNGIDGQEVSLILTFQDDTLRAEVSGTLNEGRMELVSDIDLSYSPPVVNVRESMQVMTAVRLLDPLVDEVLASINPLFGALADPSGTLDVRLDTLTWPWAANVSSEASYVFVLDIKNVILQSKGVLQEVLKKFGLENEKLVPRDTELYCSGRAGQITCSPTRISVADFEMVIGGSVGVDTTLDYLLELPVTEKLVGSDTYGALGGEVIRIPVKGTTVQPLVDQERISSAVDELLRQVAARETENP